MDKVKEILIVAGILIVGLVVVFNACPIQQDTIIEEYVPMTSEECTVYNNVGEYCSFCVSLCRGRNCIDSNYFQNVIISHYCDYNLKIWHITLYSDYYTGLDGTTMVFCY